MLQVVLLFILGVLNVMGSDYTDYGPYNVETKIYGYVMPKSTGCCDWSCHIKLTVTKPSGEAVAHDLVNREPPFPVVFMFNGFQTYARWYEEYVHHLVSYGYVVVQYDTKKVFFLADKVEMAFFPHLLSWAQERNAEPGSFLFGLMDFERVGVSGHSRGGKLAAFHTAYSDIIKSAYLIDPVDGDTTWAKESEDYPSAIKALAGKNKRIGLVGSGITGRCNPEGFNYKQFFEVVGAGSWLTVINAAGHCQYITAPPLFEWSMGVLCGHGHNSCSEVITVTRPGMVAWFEEDFRGASGMDENSFVSGGLKAHSFLDAFFEWIRNMEEKRVLNFMVKEDQNAEWDGSLKTRLWTT